MNKILIDTSVWIEYFNNANFQIIDSLIDNDKICINKLILSELLPFLRNKNELELIDILENIDEVPLLIDWNKIIDYQTQNLKNNIRKVGIPDLIILQNVIDNNLELYTLDKHFKQMKNIFKIKLFEK